MASFEIGGIGLPAELRGGLRRCAALTQPDVNTSRNRLGHIRLELDHVFEAPVEALRPDVHLVARSEEHTSELPSRLPLVCRLLLEKKKVHVAREAEGDLRLDRVDVPTAGNRSMNVA